MENNESNLKSQQTGGLKLMTVFIAVLALHVIVIGGFTVIHLMSGGSTDADLVTDKTHKGVKVTPEGSVVSDGQLPDGTSDKSATAATTPASTPTTATTPDALSTATASTDTTSISTPAPTTPTIPAPAPAPEPTANVPSGPVQSGPVITPPQIVPSAAPEVASEPAITPAPATSETEALGGASYVVKSHDSLARIAHQHHITVAKLRAANGLKNDMLRIGQKLTIPAKTLVASASTTAPAASAITPEGNTTILGDSTPAPTPKAMASTPHDQAIVSAPSGGRHTYTVMKGDTLTKIARKFRTTPNAIMAVNNISDARKMKIGQKLKIPSQEPRSANVSPIPAQQQQQPDRIEPRATPSAQLANFIP